jgi:hypothetical protein
MLATPAVAEAARSVRRVSDDEFVDTVDLGRLRADPAINERVSQLVSVRMTEATLETNRTCDCQVQTLV